MAEDANHTTYSNNHDANMVEDYIPDHTAYSNNRDANIAEDYIPDHTAYSEPANNKRVNSDSRDEEYYIK